MRQSIQHTSCARLLMIGTALFLFGGVVPAAHGDEGGPDVKITYPSNDDTVTVGPGSAQLGVRFEVNNGFLPTSENLCTRIPMGIW